jgi:hypothetical protein
MGDTEIANAKLYAALARAVARAEAIEKDAHNKFHNYKYASAEAIIAEAREALSAEGLAVFPVSIGRDVEQLDHKWGTDAEGKDYIDVPRRLRATYRLVHESGEWVEFSSTCPVIPEKGRPEDKAEFGARTENLGYMLRDLLCLPRVAGEVPSGRDDTGYQPRREAPKTQAPARADRPAQGFYQPPTPTVIPKADKPSVLSDEQSRVFDTPDELDQEIATLVSMADQLVMTEKTKPIGEWLHDAKAWKDRASKIPPDQRGAVRPKYTLLTSIEARIRKNVAPSANGSASQ